MINCRNCKFEVIANMRHSLVKNCCPACGSALLGEVHSRRLSLFKQKLTNQAFSEKLNNDDIFDIALFMLIEFFPLDLEKKEAVSSDIESDDAEPSTSEDKEDLSQEETYDEIREQVRNEILRKNEEIILDDLDVDLKIQRLKRIAKESGVRNPGAVVRRISGD